MEARGHEVAEDERDLVERARTDPDAFAALYRRYLDRVHRFAYRRSGSREVAEDVTAATFERALRYLDGFEWRPGGFAPWLFRIAANELANHYRGEYRSRTPRAQAALQALQPPTTTDDEALLRVEEHADGALGDLLHALDGLNPRYQRALSLRYFADLSLEDAATAMNCSKPTMSVMVHRAIVALRKNLRAMERPTMELPR